MAQSQLVIPHSDWKRKNEEIRFKYDIQDTFSPQTWHCLPGCVSGCYKGCDNKCWSCYIIHDINETLKS